MANTTSRRGRGPAPTGKTPQVSMRLEQAVLDQIDALVGLPDLDSRTDVVRHAVAKLFVDTQLRKVRKK